VDANRVCGASNTSHDAIKTTHLWEFAEPATCLQHIWIMEVEREALVLFDRIEATENSAITRRAAAPFQLKRMLTAHALAEEHDADRREQTDELYRGHADMKITR
jgi:hypothetical protein